MRITLIVAAALALSLAGCGTPGAAVAPEAPTSAGAVTQPTLVPDSVVVTSAPEATPLPSAEGATMPDQPTSPPLSVATVQPALRSTFTPEPQGADMSTPTNPALSALVDQAKGDLAQRRAVALDQISVVEVRSVTWPNPGLGCEQPGMAYKQVPVDGLLIRLSIGGIVFDYHSGGRKAPFLCEQPTQNGTPAPGSGSESQ